MVVVNWPLTFTFRISAGQDAYLQLVPNLSGPLFLRLTSTIRWFEDTLGAFLERQGALALSLCLDEGEVSYQV